MLTLTPTQIYKRQQSGQFYRDGVETRSTFSFGSYQNPLRNGFRALRVLNSEILTPGTNLGYHGHRDMEILSYVVAGTGFHEDPDGERSTLLPGTLLHTSAGTGLWHTEGNASATEPLHIYQIWLTPDRLNRVPSWQVQHFEPQTDVASWCLLASPDGREESLAIHQDCCLYQAQLQAQATLEFPLSDDRYGWLQILQGEILLEDRTVLEAGDGLEWQGSDRLWISSPEGAVVMLFDLA
jgi:quercetin 2,3-dioxygenase